MVAVVIIMGVMVIGSLFVCLRPLKVSTGVSRDTTMHASESTSPAARTIRLVLFFGIPLSSVQGLQLP